MSVCLSVALRVVCGRDIATYDCVLYVQVGCFTNVFHFQAGKKTFVLVVYNGCQPLHKQFKKEWAEVLSL